MAGGIANFLGAWMDGDEKAKEQLMGIMKNAFAMQSVGTQTAGMQQDQRIRGLAEQRTSQLFPSVLETSQAQARQQVSTAGTMERVEGETVDRNKAVQDELDGQTLATLTEIMKGRQMQSGIRQEDTRQALIVPEQMAEIESRTAEGEITRLDAFEEEGGPRATGAAQALEQRTLEATGKLASGVATKRATPEVIDRMVKTMEAGEQAASLQAQMALDTAQYFADNNYANILAEAETNVAGMKDDVIWAQIKESMAKAAAAGTGGARGLSAEMQMLRMYLGDEGFMKYLALKAQQETDTRIGAETYHANIRLATQQIATLQEKMNEGVDPFLAMMSMGMTPEQKASMFGGKKDEEITPDEILSSLRTYIRVQKALLKEQWDQDYDELSKMDYSQIALPDDVVAKAIELIEGNQGRPGMVGNMLRGWPKGGLASVNEATVMKNVNSILNARKPDGSKLHPMEWVDQLERNKHILLAPGSAWGTQEDYDAIVTILGTLATEMVDPNLLKGNIVGFPEGGIRRMAGEAPAFRAAPAPAPTQAPAPEVVSDNAIPGVGASLPQAVEAPAPVPTMPAPLRTEMRQPVPEKYAQNVDILPQKQQLDAAVSEFNTTTEFDSDNFDRVHYMRILNTYPPMSGSAAAIVFLNSLEKEHPGIPRRDIVKLAYDNNWISAGFVDKQVPKGLDVESMAKELRMEVEKVEAIIEYAGYTVWRSQQ